MQEQNFSSLFSGIPDTIKIKKNVKLRKSWDLCEHIWQISSKNSMHQDIFYTKCIKVQGRQ